MVVLVMVDSGVVLVVRSRERETEREMQMGMRRRRVWGVGFIRYPCFFSADPQAGTA